MNDRSEIVTKVGLYLTALLLLGGCALAVGDGAYGQAVWLGGLFLMQAGFFFVVVRS